MNRTQFQRLTEQEFHKILTINDKKGHDYAGDEDALANFKRIAERKGLTPEQVLGVYLEKHLEAIDTYIREGAVQSEPIEGRIHDAILYLFLLMGLVVERQEREVHPAIAVATAIYNYERRVDMGEDGDAA